MNKTDRIKPQIDVAVRKLAESIRRDGGLASVMQGGISGVEGTRIHQHFLKTAGYRFPGCELYPEESLSCRFTANDLPYDLNVQGRCDLAVISPEGELTVVEIKGFRGSLRSLHSDGDSDVYKRQLVPSPATVVPLSAAVLSRSGAITDESSINKCCSG